LLSFTPPQNTGNEVETYRDKAYISAHPTYWYTLLLRLIDHG